MKTPGAAVAWTYRPTADLGLPVLARCSSLARENDLASSIVRFFWWSAVRQILLTWNRLETRGAENLPARPPFVLAANHTSHLDAMALASALPLRWRDHIAPIAAGECFFASPLKAVFSAVVLNALPLWRRHCQLHALETLRERLVQRREAYILFPEGTRSRSGQMQAFKPGFGILVAGTQVPIVPCHLEGTFQAMPPGSVFVHHVPVTLTIGAPRSFDKTANDRAGWEQIARTVQSDIDELSRTRVRPAVRPSLVQNIAGWRRPAVEGREG